MKKIYVLLAIFIVGVVILSTTVYIPKGYTAVSSDGKSLYSEGVHLMQTHPLEDPLKYVQLTKTSSQCEYFPVVYATTSDYFEITMETNICWHLEANISQIQELKIRYGGDKNKVSANFVQNEINKAVIGNFADKYKNYDIDLIRPTVLTHAYRSMSKLNLSDILSDKYDTPRIAREIGNELKDKGIIIDSFELKVPDNNVLKQAITEHENIKKQAEAELKRLQEQMDAVQ